VRFCVGPSDGWRGSWIGQNSGLEKTHDQAAGAVELSNDPEATRRDFGSVWAEAIGRG
jgi:hypothetical protein